MNLAASLPGGGCRAFLFLFHLLLTALVFIWIGRYSPAPWLSAYLFVALQYFAMSMNLLRQSLAAAITKAGRPGGDPLQTRKKPVPSAYAPGRAFMRKVCLDTAYV